MNSFLFRFILLFAAVFGILFLFVFFYMSVTAPANAAELPPTVSPAVPSLEDVEPVTFDRGSVRIVSQVIGGRDIPVEIARTPEQLSRGLMYRKELAPGTGMLFVYRPPRTVGMWMKNTLISLDMLFMAPSGTIIFIKQNTTPLSEELIQPPLRVAYVLELPAGTVAARKIDLGHRLTF